MKEWYQTNELAGLPGMPSTPQGVGYKARTQNWMRRQNKETKRNLTEYHINSLPKETQQALDNKEEKATLPIASITTKEWYQTRELIGLPGMPTTTQGVSHRAKAENWSKRKATGVSGRAFEYHLDSFPKETQEALKDKGRNSSNTELAEKSIGNINLKMLEDAIDATELMEEKVQKPMSTLRKVRFISLFYMTSLESLGKEKDVEHALLEKSIEAIELFQIEVGHPMTLEQKARMITLVYMSSLELGWVDEQLSNKIVKMIV